MGDSCEISSHLINVVSASLRRRASTIALDSTATQPRGYGKSCTIDIDNLSLIEPILC